MRIMSLGGVWKTKEDEILKAAVMKYGKNQWVRISSLLVRKSPKQCKSRWYNWFDPAIKNTEWTREEDEKLIHLAKLLPTQWRTIAPIVGRTQSQCLERYEKLPDAAFTKDRDNEAAEDHMDEDEKEMLSEARARLANTRGKKAKRKAREKQLEEARKLASLKKVREVNAAGIDGRHRTRKRKGIDYNAEIPFEKRTPSEFYDIAADDLPVGQVNFPTSTEGKTRADVEAVLRKPDVARNEIAHRQDAPAATLPANKLNDPEAVRMMPKLSLSPPQMTADNELKEMANMGYTSDLLSENEELTEASAATRALLANNPADQVNFPTTIEGKTRADVEAELRKPDVARNKIAHRQDAPAASLQENKLNDPEAVRKRSKLSLSPPQMTADNELKEVANMGYASDLLAENEELTEVCAAIRTLFANIPAGNFGDDVKIEVENLARLRDPQTPVLRKETPASHFYKAFHMAIPRKKETQTSDPKLTPSMTSGDAGLTPRIGLTPSRDGSSSAVTTKRHITIKMLCHRKKVDIKFHSRALGISKMIIGVAIDMNRSFEYDDNYLIISISAEEAFEEKSKTQEAAVRLLRFCIDSETEFKRLLRGDCAIRLLLDHSVSSETSFHSYVDSRSRSFLLSPRKYLEGRCSAVWKHTRLDNEKFWIKIRGPFKKLEKPFIETIALLRRKAFMGAVKKVVV